MKNSSIENRFCMSLVAFAVIVRLLLATGAAAAVDEAFGRAPQAQAPEPDILTLEILAAPEPIVPPEPQPEAEPEPASEPGTHLHPAGLLRRGGGRDPDRRSLQLHAGQADAAPAAEQPRFSAGRADRPDRPYAFERGLYHGGRI